MALKRPKGPSGTLVVLEHTSKILKDNPLGDPHARKLAVWLPPQYDEGAGRRRFPASTFGHCLSNQVGINAITGHRRHSIETDLFLCFSFASLCVLCVERVECRPPVG